MKKLYAILFTLSNLAYSQSTSDWENLWINKINEPSLTELQEKIIFKRVNDSLVPKNEKDSIIYKNKKYKAYDFELFELKYQSAFGGLTLYRIYGDGLNYELTKKTLTDPTYSKNDILFENGIQKSDSLTRTINKSDVEKYKSELKKFSFWEIYSYKSSPNCLDGTVIKISGLNGGGPFGSLSQLNSTNCPREMELPVQLEKIFIRIFRIEN